MKKHHHKAVLDEMMWLDNIIKHRVDILNEDTKHGIDYENPHTVPSVADIGLPPTHDERSHYQQFVDAHNFHIPERMLLALCIARGIFPQMFSPLVKVYKNVDKQFEFGGVLDPHTNRFIPTLRTLFFLLAGTNIKEQFYYHVTFTPSHFLFLHNILKLEAYAGKEKSGDEEDLPYQQVKLNEAYLNYFLGEKKPSLDSDRDFPASLLETDKTFDDLVLPGKVIQQLEGPMNYIKYYEDLMKKKGAANKIKPGYLMLLHGPPGTGKTLTASVMGNYLGVDVYYLSLSRVVSKYIGETEKNLEKVFTRLEKKLCILFVDEADAIFGKRTEVKDSKDRYANQEVAYLLQRVEKFPGVVIMATNYEQNLDDAFRRRILSNIHVPLPNPEARTLLWQKSIPESFEYAQPEIPDLLARHFALTGGNISNIIKQACLKAGETQSNVLHYDLHLEPFIREEFEKDKRDFKPLPLAQRNAVAYTPPAATPSPPPTPTLSPTEQQVKFWQANLPQEWNYVPQNLPEHLAKYLTLSEEEVVWVVNATCGQYQQEVVKSLDLTKLVPGLKRLYTDSRNGVSWETLEQQLRQAISEQEASYGETSSAAAEWAEEVYEEVNPPEEMSAADRAAEPLAKGKSAVKLWEKHLPEGFVYSPSDMPENLGKYFEIKEHYVTYTLAKACERAQHQGSNQLGYSNHIAPFLKEAFEQDGRAFVMLK